MPLGLARVVHNGGSATDVVVRADNSSNAALPRVIWDWLISFCLRTVRMCLPSFHLPLALLADNILRVTPLRQFCSRAMLSYCIPPQQAVLKPSACLL